LRSLWSEETKEKSKEEKEEIIFEEADTKNVSALVFLREFIYNESRTFFIFIQYLCRYSKTNKKLI